MKTILALLMLALSAGAQGQLLKCVSKSGKVEYAQACPEGTTEQKTGIKNSPGTGGGGSAVPAAPKSLAERDADFKKRMIEQQDAQQNEAKKAAALEEKRKACELSQRKVATLQDNVRLRTTDPKTKEAVFVTDQERAVLLVEAQKQVEANCK